jgi:hypothetical protein
MRSNLRWLCVFAVVFAGYLFATKPAHTQAQLIFRIFLFVGGLVGLVMLTIRGNQKSRKDDRE